MSLYMCSGYPYFIDSDKRQYTGSNLSDIMGHHGKRIDAQASLMEPLLCMILPRSISIDLVHYRTVGFDNPLFNMNFTDFIEIELRSLEKLCKNTPLQQKTKTMLIKLSSFKQQEKSFRLSIQEDSSSTTQQLLDIATMALETKTEKIVMHGLIIIQKLMNIRKLVPQQYDEIVSHLSCLKLSEDKDLQMKTIQICLNLITPQLALIQNYEFMLKLYQICFHVAFSRELMTKKIAISAAIQLTQLIYEQERFKQYNKEELSRAGVLFNDFLGYLVDGKCAWVPKGFNGIVWDMVLEIIRIQGLNVITEPTTMQKLQRLYDTSLRKSFTKQVENKFDFIRYFRAVCFMSMYLKMGIKQLERLKIINDLTTGFVQSLYIQGAILIMNSELMRARAHAHPELISVIDTLCQLSQQLCISHQALNISEAKPRVYLQQATVLLQIDINEGVQDVSVYKMLMTGVIELRGKFENIDISDQGEVRRSLQFISPVLIKILRYLVMIDIGEKPLRNLIKEYQKWLLITCKHKLSKVRNKLLEELFLLTRKLEKKTQVIKCIEAVQIMFNLLYGYQYLLDPSSLVIMLFCFQQLQQKLCKMRRSKEWEVEMTEFQIQNTQNMIDQLYKKDGIVFTQETLKWTLESLNQITLKVMEELSQHPNDRLRFQYKTFGVRKMKQVIENNADKILLVWNLFIAQFICLSNCKSEEIRRYSIQVLTQTISKVLLQNVMPQSQLLSIYFQLVKTKYTDVKASIVQKLKVLIENYGYKMEENSLIDIVKILKLIEDPDVKKKNEEIQRLMNAEHALNQLIMRECLVNIQSIEGLKELISNFRIINSSKSIEYSGVGLFWTIPDHIKHLWESKNNSSPYNQEYLELFSSLFHKLEAIIRESEYPAMRHSSIHVITLIVAENIFLFTQSYLNNFMENVYFKIFTDVVSKYREIVNTVKDPESNIDKDSCQTCKQMFMNALKLMKRFQSEGILNQSQLKFVIDECSRMLEIERPVFLFHLLTFIKGLQELSRPEELKEENVLLDSLKLKMEKIDQKDRYIKNKVLGLLKETIEFYQKK